MASITDRGPHQFRVRVRRNGAFETKTFDSRAAAEKWARIIEGKVTGDETIDRNRAQQTTLTEALVWYEKVIIPKTPRSAKVKVGLVAYWKRSRFANWALTALHPWDLLEWRREALDEDNAEGGSQIGPDAEFGLQSAIHRLNIISHLYGQWSLIHQTPLTSPIVRGVRPLLGSGRERRLDPKPDKNGKTEEDRLYEACATSNSPWLGHPYWALLRAY